MKEFVFQKDFELETGGILQGLKIAYHTYGIMNTDKSNIVWICHALTANSDPEAWWPGMVGKNTIIDPEKYFIICANIIGSCYGTTGPLENDPATGKPYLNSFPFFTVRDMVNAHILLRKHLGIENIFLLMGGSLGGYQALEWAIMETGVIKNLFLLTTSAKESAWGKAIHQAQRLALEADTTFVSGEINGGSAGVKAARAIGMLTYRNYEIMVQKQTDDDAEKLENYMAATYIIHQGKKLAERFNAYSYWHLTRAMDTHNITRGRGGNLQAVLQSINIPTLIIGISSDMLCPPKEQVLIAGQMPNANFIEIDSVYGHDGFLVEFEKISAYLKLFLQDK